MKYNILSGASPDVNNRLYFDMFLSEKVYMGFSRRDPVWGQCALLKLAHRRPWPFGVMAALTDIGQASASKKFFDLNSYRIFPEDVQPPNGKAVYIGKVRKDNYVDPVNKTFTSSRVEFTTEEEIGQVRLDYMTSEWSRVIGLNPQWLPTDWDVYDYYLFNYMFDVDTAAKIEEMKVIDSPALYTRCRLAYTTNMTLNHPTSTITDAGLLERRIGINGEIVITGLNPEYDLLSSIKTAKFYIVDESGVVLMDGLSYVETFQDDEERALVFTYTTANGNEAKVKISAGENYLNRLAIFYESLPVASLAAPVADNNPPALTLGYIKHPAISKSIVDVLGISKIFASNVQFVREMMYTDEVAEYVALGFATETLTVDRDEDHNRGTVRCDAAIGDSFIALLEDHTFIVSDQIKIGLTTYDVLKVDRRHNKSGVYLDQPIVNPVTKDTVLESVGTHTTYDITYAVTTDPDLAVEHACDSVMITKELANDTPTDDIYRQLFISYKPKDQSGAECTFENYTDIFDNGSYMWNIGTLLYLSNKVPVYRRYIVGTEKFKIVF